MSDPQPLRAPELFTRDYAPDQPPRRRWRPWRWLLGLLLLLALAPPAAVVALRWLPPPTTAFMLHSPVQPVDYVWVPGARHPRTLRDAVIAAEDQKFYDHHGFDFEAIGKALEHNQTSRRKRGASTISQQVAKNLFMWPSRSYLRKGVEASFTVLIELAWPKERILETYLNIAEFGPGTFGVEAAARKFFDKSAQELSPAESARLAAVLPNPRKWSARHPGPYVQARVDWILAQIGYGPRPLPEPEPGPEDQLEDGFEGGLEIEPEPEWAPQPLPGEPPLTEPVPGEPPVAEPVPGEPGEPAEPQSEPPAESEPAPADAGADPYADPYADPSADPSAEPAPDQAPGETGAPDPEPPPPP